MRVISAASWQGLFEVISPQAADVLGTLLQELAERYTVNTFQTFRCVCVCAYVCVWGGVCVHHAGKLMRVCTVKVHTVRYLQQTHDMHTLRHIQVQGTGIQVNHRRHSTGKCLTPLRISVVQSTDGVCTPSTHWTH